MSHKPQEQALTFTFFFQQVNFNDAVDCWWHELMSNASDKCEPCWVDAEDPLFMLYTRYLKLSKYVSFLTKTSADQKAFAGFLNY